MRHRAGVLGHLLRAISGAGIGRSTERQRQGDRLSRETQSERSSPRADEPSGEDCSTAELDQDLVRLLANQANSVRRRPTAETCHADCQRRANLDRSAAGWFEGQRVSFQPLLTASTLRGMPTPPHISQQPDHQNSRVT
jgi:hypothetical protein